MANAEAQALVLGLKARGMSNTAIARQLGRDQRAVGQIARGERGPGYGAALVPALRQIKAGATPTPPPRRTGATGQLARVRGRAGTTVTPVAGGRAVKVAVERGWTADTATRVELDRAVHEGQHVKMVAEWPDEQRVLWSHGGYRAEGVRGDLIAAGWDLYAFVEGAVDFNSELTGSRFPEMSNLQGITLLIGKAS